MDIGNHPQLAPWTITLLVVSIPPHTHTPYTGREDNLGLEANALLAIKQLKMGHFACFGNSVTGPLDITTLNLSQLPF